MFCLRKKMRNDMLMKEKREETVIEDLESDKLILDLFHLVGKLVQEARADHGIDVLTPGRLEGVSSSLDGKIYIGSSPF
jgi:hypothetical protein